MITLVRDPDAASYQLRWAAERPDGPPEEWTIENITVIQKPFLLQNLTPGIVYEFQVRALIKTTNRFSDWSDSVRWMAR